MTKECCASLGDCNSCFGNSNCLWCKSSSNCIPKIEQETCTLKADDKCCNVKGDCNSCNGDSSCNWCIGQDQGACTLSGQCPIQDPPDPKCCSTQTSCQDCTNVRDDGCGWCPKQSHCSPLTTSCNGGFAGVDCCEAISDCQDCQAKGPCEYCIVDGICHSKTALCPDPADSKCCNVNTASSCSACVDQEGCSFCTDSRICTDQSCETLSIRNDTQWQCSIPVLLSCEAQTTCGTCVDTSGCVWVDYPWINGIPVGTSMCFTGGLFSLDNTEVPGFVLTAPNGWYFGTCSLNALSLIILVGSLVGAFLVTVLIVVLVCIWWRRRKARAAKVSYEPVNSGGDVFKTRGFEEEESISESVEQTKKKKKKKYAKPVEYRPSETLETNNRYYQARKKKSPTYY